ncbi:hypothetical protein [Phenylobacterium sp.]|nr:hypothetical protein [Phenylobacterium sp.]MDP1873669.1 hypothetical protein [Phenylobacterium sp.]
MVAILNGTFVVSSVGVAIISLIEGDWSSVVWPLIALYWFCAARGHQ